MFRIEDEVAFRNSSDVEMDTRPVGRPPKLPRRSCFRMVLCVCICGSMASIVAVAVVLLHAGGVSFAWERAAALQVAASGPTAGAIAPAPDAGARAAAAKRMPALLQRLTYVQRSATSPSADLAVLERVMPQWRSSGQWQLDRVVGDVALALGELARRVDGQKHR